MCKSGEQLLSPAQIAKEKSRESADLLPYKSHFSSSGFLSENICSPSTNDDAIPDEIEPEVKPQRSDSKSRPFCPGKEETRNLPTTPGGSRTKKILDRSKFNSHAINVLASVGINAAAKSPQFSAQAAEEEKQHQSLSQPDISITTESSDSLSPSALPRYAKSSAHLDIIVEAAKGITIPANIASIQKGLINAT